MQISNVSAGPNGKEVVIVMQPGDSFIIKTEAGHSIDVEHTQDTIMICDQDGVVCFNSEKEYIDGGPGDQGEWVRRTPVSARFTELMNESD